MVVGARRGVMERHQLTDVGRARQRHGVIDRGVPELLQSGKLRGGVLRVVDEQVDPGGQRTGSLVQHPEA